MAFGCAEIIRPFAGWQGLDLIFWGISLMAILVIKESVEWRAGDVSKATSDSNPLINICGERSKNFIIN
jgi:hypothetical protein